MLGEVGDFRVGGINLYQSFRPDVLILNMLIIFETDILIKSYNQKVFLCYLKKYLKRRSFEAEGRYIS